MSISTVVTEGYGPSASIALVVTSGYALGAAVVVARQPDRGWVYEKKRKKAPEPKPLTKLDVERMVDAIIAKANAPKPLPLPRIEVARAQPVKVVPAQAPVKPAPLPDPPAPAPVRVIDLTATRAKPVTVAVAPHVEMTIAPELLAADEDDVRELLALLGAVDPGRNDDDEVAALLRMVA